MNFPGRRIGAVKFLDRSSTRRAVNPFPPPQLHPRTVPLSNPLPVRHAIPFNVSGGTISSPPAFLIQSVDGPWISEPAWLNFSANSSRQSLHPMASSRRVGSLGTNEGRVLFSGFEGNDEGDGGAESLGYYAVMGNF